MTDYRSRVVDDELLQRMKAMGAVLIDRARGGSAAHSILEGWRVQRGSGTTTFTTTG